MNEDTMTEDRAEEPEVTLPDLGDLVAATTARWRWEDDAGYLRQVEYERRRRDRKAEAHSLLARTVIEHDLPWPSLDLHPYDRPEGEHAVLVAKYWAEDLDTFRLLARGVRRAVGGLQTKTNEDGSLTATVASGPLAWDVVLSKESSPCEQVEVGTETKVVREEIAPPRYREVEREEPVYEWRCPPSVLDPDLLAEAEDAVVDGEELDEAPATVEG